MKKVLILCLAIFTVVGLSVAVFATDTQLVRGDVNNDGTCNIEDALIVLRATLNGDATNSMDFNEDGKVSLLDVLIVLKLVVTNNTGEEITEPTFVVKDVTTLAGDTAVNIPVSIVKNPGILGMTLVVSYDDTVMTLVDSANGDALDMLSFTAPKRYKSGCIFTWYGEAMETTEITDGNILTLTFNISSTATGGTYPVEISYIEGDVFDANLAPIEIAVRNGNLTVTQ